MRRSSIGHLIQLGTVLLVLLAFSSTALAGTEEFAPGTYEIVIEYQVLNDDCGHEGFVGTLPTSITMILDEDGNFVMQGDPPWVELNGSFDTDGTVTGAGTGTVAGFGGTSAGIDGSINAFGIITGELSFGAAGELPGGCPITWAMAFLSGPEPAPEPTTTTTSTSTTTTSTTTTTTTTQPPEPTSSSIQTPDPTTAPEPVEEPKPAGEGGLPPWVWILGGGVLIGIGGLGLGGVGMPPTPPSGGRSPTPPGSDGDGRILSDPLNPHRDPRDGLIDPIPPSGGGTPTPPGGDGGIFIDPTTPGELIDPIPPSGGGTPTPPGGEGIGDPGWELSDPIEPEPIGGMGLEGGAVPIPPPGGPIPSPGGKAAGEKPKCDCKIEVGGHHLGGGIYHTFLLFTAPDCRQWVLRAGPEALRLIRRKGTGPLDDLKAWWKLDGLSGPVAVEHTAWAKGETVDWTEKPDTVLVVEGEKACKAWDCLKEKAEYFKSKNLDYEGIPGPNCNTFVGSLLRWCGFDFKPTGKSWTDVTDRFIGWDHHVDASDWDDWKDARDKAKPQPGTGAKGGG